jgi:hypothetical protein
LVSRLRYRSNVEVTYGTSPDSKTAEGFTQEPPRSSLFIETISELPLPDDAVATVAHIARRSRDFAYTANDHFSTRDIVRTVFDAVTLASSASRSLDIESRTCNA